MSEHGFEPIAYVDAVSETEASAYLLSWINRQLVAEQSIDVLADDLVAKGWGTRNQALNLLWRVRGDLSGSLNPGYDGPFLSHLFIGLIVAGGAGAISLATYESAASNPDGGRYIVFYGAIIYGLLRLVQA